MEVSPHNAAHTPNRRRFPKTIRVYVLGGNVVLSFLAFISIATVCAPRKLETSGGKRSTTYPVYFCSQSTDNLKPSLSLYNGVYIIWIVITIVETAITSAVFVSYIFFPQWKKRHSFQIYMVLYNLIQSLMHVYFWMLGTLREDEYERSGLKRSTDPSLISATLFTQLNGFLYFGAIYFCRESKRDSDMQDDEGTFENSKESVLMSTGLVSSEVVANTSSNVEGPSTDTIDEKNK